jgi:hypothetical protein
MGGMGVEITGGGEMEYQGKKYKVANLKVTEDQPAPKSGKPQSSIWHINYEFTLTPVVKDVRIYPSRKYPPDLSLN